MITLALAIAVSVFGYVQTRGFVRRRLTYVDAVHTGAAPLLAGAAAALVAMPVMGILPWVGAVTALFFGVGVGAGVRSGARDTRRRRITA